jgi:hypothetical protein
MGVLVSFVEATDAELDAIRSAPEKAEPLLYEPGERLRCSLDKAWACLCHLFSAAGYHRARDMLSFESELELEGNSIVCVSSEEIATICKDIGQAGVREVLAAAYSPEDLVGVYPDMWARDGDRARDYVLGYVPKLARFTEALRERGRGALGACG